MDLNDYQAAARRVVVSATNAAAAWDDHPTHSTRPDVLRGLTMAQGALLAVQDAEGSAYDGREVVAGISITALREVIELVKGRKHTTNGAIRAAALRAQAPGRAA